ncbi:nuclear transport factor 2 family protein [Nocardia sp. NPDC004123]
MSFEQEYQLSRLVTRYGRVIDDRDWNGLGSLLADSVTLDFSSLWGGEAETVSRTELVRRWRDMGESLDATQHLITGILAEIDGERATVTTNLVATHRRSTTTGGPLWVVGGVYRFGLLATATSWAINELALRATWVDGNQAVVTAAPR